MIFRKDAKASMGAPSRDALETLEPVNKAGTRSTTNGASTRSTAGPARPSKHYTRPRRSASPPSSI